MAEYPYGMDCVWIGMDIKGQLGAFITGGLAPIPVKALAFDLIPFEMIEIALQKLPETTKVKPILKGYDNANSIINLAEKGFFVYDWVDVGRIKIDESNKYELVVEPIKPLISGNLPELVLKLANNIMFENINFAIEKKIDVTIFFSCRNGDDSQFNALAK